MAREAMASGLSQMREIPLLLKDEANNQQYIMLTLPMDGLIGNNSIGENGGQIVGHFLSEEDMDVNEPVQMEQDFMIKTEPSEEEFVQKYQFVVSESEGQHLLFSAESEPQVKVNYTQQLNHTEREGRVQYVQVMIPDALLGDNSFLHTLAVKQEEEEEVETETGHREHSQCEPMQTVAINDDDNSDLARLSTLGLPLINGSTLKHNLSANSLPQEPTQSRRGDKNAKQSYTQSVISPKESPSKCENTPNTPRVESVDPVTEMVKRIMNTVAIESGDERRRTGVSRIKPLWSSKDQPYKPLKARRKKLGSNVIDQVPYLTAEDMKDQLRYTNDILRPIEYVAPKKGQRKKSKRSCCDILKMFTSPQRNIGSKTLSKYFTSRLVSLAVADDEVTDYWKSLDSCRFESNFTGSKGPEIQEQ